MIPRILMILIIAWASTTQAEVLRFKVKALLVEDENAVSKEYLDHVLDSVQSIFLSELHIRLRIYSRLDHRLVHSDFLALDTRYNEFEAWSKLLKKRKSFWRRITVVIVPPSYYAEQDYSWGFSTWFCMAVVRTTNCFGADRFNQSWVAVAHEIAHVMGANHTTFARTDSIMHPDALSYADNDLKFLPSTKREIREFIRTAKG